MRLIVVISISYLIVALGVFFASGVITYNSIKEEIDIEQRRFLLERLKQTERYIERRQPTTPIIREKLAIYPLDSATDIYEPVYSDTIVIHSTLQRLEPHLKLSTISKVGENYYKIELFDIIIESDDISDGIVRSMVRSYIILLISFTIIGAILSFIILKPFQGTLDFIKGFSITSPKRRKLPKTRISEFKKLNIFLDEMTRKMHADYTSLKEFTENASHELQTPLAITQAKLETLVNDESLTEEQISLLNAAHRSIMRLSKISNSLAMLTKLDNQEFTDKEEIDVGLMLIRMIEDFNELYGLKGITLEKNIQTGLLLHADRGLIEMMISNLMNNAIRHNYENGHISVSMKGSTFEISNTSLTFIEKPEALFERFKKSNQNQASLGLGLAIVKKVANYYQFGISYNCESIEQEGQNISIHKITITF